jgi:hypothetical protein
MSVVKREYKIALMGGVKKKVKSGTVHPPPNMQTASLLLYQTFRPQNATQYHLGQ